MAATPPLQIVGSPQTPTTPLYGAAHDYETSPRRTSARLRQKRVAEEAVQSTPRATRSERTPESPRASIYQSKSPGRTPQRKSNTRRVQILSPLSPDSDSSAPKYTTTRQMQSQPSLSTGTTMSEGMLPTPVKTPNKKQKTINKSNIAARALFQDHTAANEVMPSPRRNRKSKRYNGFSLESFQAENGNEQSGIQIFTDSRDQVPTLDKGNENPFIEHTRLGATSSKVGGTAKRRKVSGPRKMDSQVEESLETDEGMVYVFRGKKVYRRFDDAGEEEEEIDADDLGLLQHAPDGTDIVKPLRTLTRKSIRPTRLFQTEAQKQARQLEKDEEAATTDIEEAAGELEAATGDIEDGSDQEHAMQPVRGKGKGRSRPPGTAEDLRIGTGGKKVSPFDSWPRVKPGSASSSSASRPTRGRKRAASETLEESLDR